MNACKFSGNCESDSDDQEDVADLVLDKTVNRLTDFVRKQYCSYLEKLLEENYKNWCMQKFGNLEKPPGSWIKKCVEIYEENAIKSCMIVQFYRQSMLRTMARIRKFSINGKLADKIKQYSEKDNTVDTSIKKLISVGTQTKDLIQDNLIDTTFQNNITPAKILDYKNIIKNSNNKDISLDEKLNYFRKRFINGNVSEESKRKRIKNELDLETSSLDNSKEDLTTQCKIKSEDFKTPLKKTIIPIKSEKINDEKTYYPNIEEQLDEIFEAKEDDIAKELDKMFKDDQTEIDDIFGNVNNIEDPEITSILKEIEFAILPTQKTIDDIKSENATVIREDEHESIDMKKNVEIKENIQCDDNLRNSLWPCELHMRRQRLREKLCQIVEEFGMHCHENLKIKFIELFGEDEEDEFAPYSPTLELDDILLSSCKKRIAPWIVKYLMIPMNQGKINDRILFKKFAKKISHKIILENQYPSEQYIKSAIENYFLAHQAITSHEDIKI